MTKGYPRPQLKRDNWVNLNGKWDFKFDDENQGLKNDWNKYFTPDYQINVPFSYETNLSGINSSKQHKIMWYHRKINGFNPFKNTILHFGAVDYECTVYINGEKVFFHRGGNTSFKIDITDYLDYQNDNDLTVRVYDDMEDLEMPRGKQYWKEVPESIYYTNTSGIWQTVWLEEVGHSYVDTIKITPDIDTQEVKIKYNLILNKENLSVKTIIKYNNEKLVEEEQKNVQESFISKIKIRNLEEDFLKTLWSPEVPNLYGMEIFIMDGEIVVDQISSYFGMRKISIKNGNVELNNQKYYMRLVLDQGYYPESLLTSPSDDDLIKDIMLTKKMGFNGVRKHQKIEEERYLYYADKYGLLLWEEMPSAYQFSAKSKENLKNEWQEAIKRDYNHPCIVVWVPMNESWGVPNLKTSNEQVQFLDEMYNYTKNLDNSRLIVSNDGWEHSKTDLFTIHDYESDYDILLNRYKNLENILSSEPGYKPLFNKGYKYDNQPILVTEFGGISFKQNDTNGWGYSHASDSNDFEKRLKKVVIPIIKSSLIQGFCYTQLTDVQQEINGLLTFDRKPKIDINKIRDIILNIKNKG